MRDYPGHAAASSDASASVDPVCAPDQDDQEWLLIAAFDALSDRTDQEEEDEEEGDDIGLKTLEDRLDKGKGKQLTRHEERDGDIEDEILPTEEEAWASWPTALDEYQVEDAFAQLGEVERGWLMFELALIEPALLVDAATGFPRGVFEDIAINGGVFPSVAAGEGTGKGKKKEQEEGMWARRTRITVPRQDWLLTLAQSQAIPSDARDTFMLNLFLIAYPFGQYLLHSFADSLAQARSLWVARALEAQVDDDEVKKKELWHRYRDERVQLETKLWRASPGGWKKWELNWTVAPSLSSEEVGSKTEGEVLDMAGVWAHRPFVDPGLLAFEIDHMLASPSASLLLRPDPVTRLKPRETFHNLRQTVQLALALLRSPRSVRTQLKYDGGAILDKLVTAIRTYRDMLNLQHKPWLDLDVAYAWDMVELSDSAAKLGLDVAGLQPWTVLDTK